jgi:hypothetical protein
MTQSRHASSGGALVLVILYTLALFKAPPLRVMRVIEHFTPRLRQRNLL